MIREPATRTLGFERCASATTSSSAGSSKTSHHVSCGTSAAGGASASASSGDTGQSSSHGTAGRSKSGPTAVQPLASSAASAAGRLAGQKVPAMPDIVQSAGWGSPCGWPRYTQAMKIW